ncbi:hypothetical protein MTP99_006806 [Tenebrio molitor]|nr:hypothetical protein MTP99_006806 [Tenebrio molitor]
MASKNTPGLGVEYEILVPAYLALNLNNEDIQDYTIQSNVKNFGNMDDVVIDISMKDKKKFGFAMQLKHKDNDSKKLSPESFETANGPFSLKRYCQAFKNLNQRNRQLFDESSLTVVMSTHSLPTNPSWRRISIKENQIYDSLTRPINILCADPGMGKSTMLKKLRKECDSKFWITAIDLKTHNEFLKTKHDINDLLDYLLEGNQDDFSDQIRNIFRCKKKVVFFFDGLDEIEIQYADNVLNYVKELSSKGYYIWLSSRKNLKDKLKELFGEFIMDMEEVNEEQQKSYIRNRLEKTYEYGEIKNLVKKIFNSTDIINNCQVLGIPLQLYIITQTFLDDRELYDNITENIFVLTKMYNLFFRGKFKHNRDKEHSNNPHLDLTDMEDCLEKYELLAVHSMFDDNVFQKLNVDMRRTRRFLHEFKSNKDLLGIVTKVNTEGKAEFEHYTYGEYFAANFFANNFDKARIIQKELFSNRYKNLMMIFNVILAEESPLHLALIYQNMDQFAKHVKNKNTESGSIITKKSALVRIPEVVQNVQQIVEKHPSTSIRRLKQQVNLSYNTCQKILKKDINSFPYKIGVLHEIKPEDYPKRMINITEFCQSISPE